MQSNHENCLSVHRQSLIKKAIDLGLILSIQDLTDIKSAKILIAMANESFLIALKEKHFSLADIKRIISGYLEFYTDLVTDYEEATAAHLSKPYFDIKIVLSAEREMIEFLRTMSTPPYLDSLRAEEYTMDYVYLCVNHWGPKALQILRTELAAAIEENRISKEELEEMTLEEIKNAVDSDTYPREALNASYLTA